jgi:hypothetical protein
MKERMICLTFMNGEVGVTLGANYAYTTTVTDLTIVAVSVSPSTDDAGATIDINDDGTGVITGIDLSDQNVPGTWLTPGFGGTNTPVFVAAGSLLSLDANSIDAGTTANVHIYALTGEVSA